MRVAIIISIFLLIVSLATLLGVFVKRNIIPNQPRQVITTVALTVCLTSFAFFVAFLLFLSNSLEKAATPAWVIKLAEEKNANQIFIVAGVGDTTAYVSMHEKGRNGNWKTIVTTPGYIGKYGLGKTKEGDGMSPVGTFHFTEAFGIAPDPGCFGFKYTQVNDSYYWSGDPNYNYNKMIKIQEYPSLDMDDSEHIVDYDYQYQYCLNISYNEDGTPGKGSAIFLHCLGPYKPYTGGCVAIPKACMEKVLKNVNKDCVVVIDSLKNLSPETWESWGL